MEPMLLVRGSGLDDDQFELILLEYNDDLKRYRKTAGRYLEQMSSKGSKITVQGDRAYMDLDTMSHVVEELGFKFWEVTLI